MLWLSTALYLVAIVALPPDTMIVPGVSVAGVRLGATPAKARAMLTPRANPEQIYLKEYEYIDHSRHVPGEFQDTFGCVDNAADVYVRYRHYRVVEIAVESCGNGMNENGISLADGLGPEVTPAEVLATRPHPRRTDYAPSFIDGHNWLFDYSDGVSFFLRTGKDDSPWIVVRSLGEPR